MNREEKGRAADTVQSVPAASVVNPTGDERYVVVSEFAALGAASRRAWAWFGSFRRTRPFWGGVWMLVAGLWILRFSEVGVAVAVHGGVSASGGYISGGGLLACGLVALTIPSQRYVSGLIGVLLAIASLIISNLGGFFIGMALGVVGGGMVFGWGPKKKAPRSKARARRAA